MDSQTTTPSNNSSVEIPQEVKKYLESLLNDAQVTLIDEQMKEEMIRELYERLDHYLTGVIVNNLPSDQLENFVKMNEEKKPREEIEQFIKEHVPKAEEVFASAFIDFRNLYLGKKDS